MKSLLGIKSQVSQISYSRQAGVNNMAMLDKYEATKYYAGNDNAIDFDDRPIEIDEMQIDKLYQSL